MNENTPIPPAIPPHIPVSALGLPPAMLPLGENPDDLEQLPNAISAIESILRRPRRIMYRLRQPGSGGLIFSMVAVAIWVMIERSTACSFSALRRRRRRGRSR